MSFSRRFSPQHIPAILALTFPRDVEKSPKKKERAARCERPTRETMTRAGREHYPRHRWQLCTQQPTGVYTEKEEFRKFASCTRARGGGKDCLALKKEPQRAYLHTHLRWSFVPCCIKLKRKRLDMQWVSDRD